MDAIKLLSQDNDSQRKELEEISPKAKKAMELFREGYNCAQSTFGAFYTDLGLTKNQAMGLASLRCGVWSSHCGGFYCCGARALSAWASVVVAHGLSSCGSQAPEHRLSSCDARA